jgi:hypothetical protein
MYPDSAIHVQRNAARTDKPYFYLEHINDQYTDRGRNYHDVLRTMRIHLITEGNAVNSPTSDVYWRTREVLDFLANRLQEERVIPHYFYNLVYPSVAVTLRSGGSFPSGTRQFAITALTSGGDESLLSMPVNYDVPGGKRLIVLAGNWPSQSPFASAYRVYTRESAGQSWTCVAEQSIWLRDGTLQGNSTTEIEITSLSSLGHTPPTTCRIRHGYMKVQEATMNITESMMLEDAFHGYVQLKALCHSYHRRDPESLLANVTASTTIN